jgi:hypothetical protein
MGVKLSNFDFLINFPNLKYFCLEAAEYQNNVIDIRDTKIKYFIASHIRNNENIILMRNDTLDEFICLYSDIILDNNHNIKVIDNYTDFINEPKYFRLFD